IQSTLTDSDQYQIKISDAANPSVYDYSDHFEIFTPRITIISPNSMSSWETDTSQRINWTSKGDISEVKIDLYLDAAFVMEISTNTSNDGEYTWTIQSTLTDSDQYQIKISDAANPSVYDFSDHFEVKSPVSRGSAIPGYDLYLLIGLICVISVIFIKNRTKK
ncbi:MAG: GPI anchored serine-threonine rich family protein, partial [Promethearchaeota archaeon]